MILNIYDVISIIIQILDILFLYIIYTQNVYKYIYSSLLFYIVLYIVYCLSQIKIR